MTAAAAGSTAAAGSAAAARSAARRVVAAAFAPASAVLHAFRVRQLVAQAALQAPAQPRELRRVEAQLLLLRHLDRDRLEGLPKRRAAERSAAGSAAAARSAARRVVAAAFAPASAVLHAFRVRQLVAQAALQAPAQPRELRRVEAQLLLLRHLDRDRLEGLQKRRAAERPAAGAVAAVHLRFVADADL